MRQSAGKGSSEASNRLAELRQQGLPQHGIGLGHGASTDLSEVAAAIRQVLAESHDRGDKSPHQGLERRLTLLLRLVEQSQALGIDRAEMPGDDLPREGLLRTEVIVGSGQIRPGSRSDGTQGCARHTPLGDQRLGGFEEAQLGILGRGRRRHRIGTFSAVGKRTIMQRTNA